MSKDKQPYIEPITSNVGDALELKYIFLFILVLIILTAGDPDILDSLAKMAQIKAELMERQLESCE